MTDVGIITASQGAVMYNDGTVNIRNSNFTGNTAYVGWLFGGGGNGGVAYNTGHMTITNSTFKDNSASNNGGVIYNTGNLDIQNSSFEGNNARTSGGVIASSGNVVIQNSNFTANSITGSQNGGGANSNTGNFTIYDSNFNDNTAVSGGANYNLNGNMNIYNTNFTNNSATQGGANSNRNGTFEIKDSIFRQNSAVNGGANCNRNGTFSITNSTFKQNTATQNGAIIYNDDVLDVSKLTLIDNSDVNGASIYTTKNITMLNTVVNNTFETYVYDNTDFISPLIATNLPANEDVIFSVDGNNIIVNKNTTNNIIKTVYNFTSSGLKRVNIVYPDSSNNAVIIFNVKKRDINMTLNPVDDIKTLTNVTITGTIKTTTGDDVHGAIAATVKINGQIYSTTTITDGKINIKLNVDKNLPGRYNITVETTQTGAYNNATESVVFNIVKRNITFNVSVNTPNATKFLNVNITAIDSDNNPVNTGVVTFKFDGSTITSANPANGMLHLYYLLPMKYVYGSYPLSCEFSSPYYDDVTKDVTVNVERNNIVDPAIPDMTIKTLNNITISKLLKDEAADQLVGRINAKIYLDDVFIKDVVINNGNLNIDLKTDTLSQGNYTIRYEINQNGYYNSKTFTSKLMVVNHIANITLTTNTPKTTQTLQVNATVTREDGSIVNRGVVVFKINNAEIGRSNVTNGHASINYTLPPQIIAEDYMIVAQFSAPYYENQSQWREFSVIRSDITQDTLPDTTIKTQNNLKIETQLTDEHGAQLIGLNQIKVYINGTHLRDITINNGKINTTIPSDTLLAGIYNVRYEVAQSGLYNAKTINQKLIIENKTAIITVDTNTPKTTRNFNVNATIRDSDGNPVSSGNLLIKDNKLLVDNITITGENTTLNYLLPANIVAGDYVLEIEYVNEYFDKCIVYKNVSVIRTDIGANTIYTPVVKTQQNATMNEVIYDEFGVQLKGTTEVEVLINGTSTLNTTITDGLLNIELPTYNLPKGVYPVVFKFKENGLYNAKEITTTGTILNHVAVLNMSVNNPKTLQQLNMDVKVEHLDSSAVESGRITFKLRGNTIGEVDVNGGWANLTYTLTDDITAGEYTIVVEFNDPYFDVQTSSKTFNVTRIDIADHTFGDITIKTCKNATVNEILNDEYGAQLVGENQVTIYVNDTELKTITITGGVLNTTIPTCTLHSGIYNIRYEIAQSGLYNAKTLNQKLIVENKTATITIDTNTPKTTRNLIVNATIVDENANPVNTGRATIRFNGNNLTTVDVNNGLVTATYKLPSNIIAGNYTVEVIFNDPYYNTATATGNVEVIKSDIQDIVIPTQTIKTQTNATITEAFHDEFNEDLIGESRVEIYVDSINVKNVTIVGGIFNEEIPTDTLLDGLHKVELKIVENDLYNGRNLTTSINIENREVTVDITVNNPKTTQNLIITATVKEDGNIINQGSVEFILNGEKIGKTTVIDGVATYTYTLPSTITAGNYTLIASFSDTFYNAQNNTTIISVERSDIADITIADTTIKTENNITINEILHDIYGNQLVGENKVEILINNVAVENITIKDGILKKEIILSNYTMGEYTITLKIYENGLYNAKRSIVKL